MPIIMLPITAHGALIDVAVGLSQPHQMALRQNARSVPPMAQSRMLIDTGASHSAVDRSLIDALGLTPRGKVYIQTPSTEGLSVEREQYDVSIHILHEKLNYTLHTLPVITGEFSSQGHLGLLGRDVLKDCTLIYHGTANLFSLSF